MSVVLRRPARPRALAPTVVVPEETKPRGWLDLASEVRGEFRRFGKVFNGDEMVSARNEFRMCA